LKGTIHYGMWYIGDSELLFHVFVDLDQVGDATTLKSTSDCCFSLRSRMFRWFNKKQATIALSLVVTKYMVACFANCEAIWFCKLLGDLAD
jgi:hypothetical protein